MNVALVGGGGLVGRATAEILRTSRCTPVIIDQRPDSDVVLDLTSAKASDRLSEIFDQRSIEAVVHLAARVDPPRDAVDRERMRHLHEHGTRAVCAATLRRGAHLTLVSSAVVYGARADNVVPLPTTAPVRPNALPYAIDKAAQEAIAVSMMGDDLAIIRPAIIYAPQAKNYLTEIVRRARLPFIATGVLPALDGHEPPLQFVHLNDVARFIKAIVERRARGVFHAASTTWLSYDEVADAAGLRTVTVPTRVIGPLLESLVPWMPPSLRAPRALFPYLMHPFVIDMAETIELLDEQPMFTSRDALMAMLRR